MSDYSFQVFIDTTGFGHAFIGLYGPGGASQAWGYWPDVHDPQASFDPITGHALVAEGQLIREDQWFGALAESGAEMHPFDWSSDRIAISKEQYDAMVDHAQWTDAHPGTYGALGNNCVQFVEDMLGIADAPQFGDVVTPASLLSQLEWIELLRKLRWPEVPSVSYDMVVPWQGAQRWTPPARRDPLTLDLDGDGLETVGIDPTQPILFDHDGDGIKTGTGWVLPDDAFLAMDRNANGTIDTGAELFGDSTPRYAGGMAADGFAALAQEDTNADGRVNASDTRFAQLKLWRDLDQDGLTDAGELQTLAEAGIEAINVARLANNQVLANGNRIADLGTYVRVGGAIGDLGVSSQMADIDLAEDTFLSRFTDSVPLTPAAETLPDMYGSGQVRPLRQAASLSGALATLVQGFVNAPTLSD